MAESTKTGLWSKDGKTGPYWGGQITIHGQEFWVNLYANEQKKTDKHPDLTLYLKPKEPKEAQQQPTQNQEIPF